MTTLIFEWFLLFFFFRASAGLYEDQIGKFEWRQQYIGKLKYSHFDTISPIKKVLVATEQNVLAALSLKSGDIIWRQILESQENGTIKLLSVDREIITISGGNPLLVRGWELEHGFLLWEWAVTPYNEFTKWIHVKEKLIQMDLHSSSHIVAVVYDISTGRKLKSQNIAAAWLIPENCVVQNDVLACITRDKVLYSIKLMDNGNDDIGVVIHHRSLNDLFKQQVIGNLKATTGKSPIVSVNVGNIPRAIALHPEIQVIETGNDKAGIIAASIIDQQLAISSFSVEDELLDVKTVSVDGKVLPEYCNKINYARTHGDPESALLFCQQRKDKGMACRLLISTTHDVIMLLQHPGKILWTREESLSSILTVEMISLPVSDTDAAIEKEFDNKNSGFVGMFFRRLLTQTLQLQNSLLTVLGVLKGASVVDSSQSMTQDEFGLHKLIITATKTGKIYGLDNLTGKIVWQIKIDNIEPYSTGTGAQSMPLYVLRNARHHPLPPECALLVKYKATGEAALVVFNPITGSFPRGNPLLRLGFKVKQSLLLHMVDQHFYKGIIFLDDENKVHVYPESSKAVALSQPSSIFMYTADGNSGILEGFTLSHSTKDALIASKTWQICLGSTIIAVVGKNQDERVHSQGRVLGDRSVLYKYVNPNLIAVVNRAYHPSHKTVINLHLIDVVSGNIIYSSSHRRAKEPVHVVHSENWVVYTYFNEKYRRTELGALEMYEGKTQSNSTAFSSVDSAVLLPIVEKQAYILPANVLGLKETITERGITSKHILVALSAGGILELPWAYADPRRPMTVTPEMREEGVIPYMPELPISLEAIINHNQTINNIRGIHTSSSGLESTCLVFAYGLDTFYTRVAPSKTFDLLKDDFDYYLITLVLFALVTVSYITKRLASRKALRQAWK